MVQTYRPLGRQPTGKQAENGRAGYARLFFRFSYFVY